MEDVVLFRQGRKENFILNYNASSMLQNKKVKL